MAKVRTFIAIEIPKKVQSKAFSVIDKLSKETSSIRWVSRENLHVTLKFLGDVEDRDTYAVCQAVTEVTRQNRRFTVDCNGIGAFPSVEKPRTIWLGIDEPENRLSNMYAEMEDSLQKLGYPQEARQFRPHLTIGRIQHGRRNMGNLTTQMQNLSTTAIGEIPVNELVIFSSELTRSGPIYTTLGRATLKSARR